MIDSAATAIPDAVRVIVRLYLGQISALTEKIHDLHFKRRVAAKVDVAMRRLCTVPGVRPVSAGARKELSDGVTAVASNRGKAGSA